MKKKIYYYTLKHEQSYDHLEFVYDLLNSGVQLIQMYKTSNTERVYKVKANDWEHGSIIAMYNDQIEFSYQTSL